MLLKFPVTLLLIVFLSSACNTFSTTNFYENSEYGIRLEKPENWELEFIERSGIIVLMPKTHFWNNDSVLVEIMGVLCSENPTPFSNSLEKLDWDIDRIRKLYHLDSVTIVQEPRIMINGENEVTNAVIAIPTASMPKDTIRIQVGDRSTKVFQNIEIFVIRGVDDKYIMAYIYEGNSEVLNAKAQDIVRSIQNTCTS